jgi:phage terminase large subunit-like protein
MNKYKQFDETQLNILKYSNDPVLFTTDLIGLECADFHQEWLKAFQENRYVVLLAPRGHGKTSIVGSYLLWRIVRDRTIRALIVTINQDKANHMMTFVQENLERNTKLIDLFGDFKGNSEWSRNQFRVKQPKGFSVPHPEPTLKVLGVGSGIISAHYDLIILDDITDDENSRTELRRTALENWYDGPLVGTFIADTSVIDIGTRWHENDIHSYLMRKSGYKTFRYKALINEPDKDGKGAKVLWPTARPWDETMAKEYELASDTLNLKFIREHQGEYYFAMQYQNEIIPTGVSKFKQEWIKSSTERYKKLDGILPSNLKKYIGLDFGGEDVNSDWGVSVVVGIDEKGDIYILDLTRTHSTVNRQLDNMMSLDEKWHVSKIGMEASAQQKYLVSDAKRNNPSLPIIPIKSSTINNKDTRVDRLSILFETNRMYLNPNLLNLIDELSLYPRSKNDDCLDALSFAIEASQNSNIINWKDVPNVIFHKKYYIEKV